MPILDTIDVDPEQGLVMLTGRDSISAQVERRLRYARGDFWLNQQNGIPYDLLLGHHVSPEALSAEIIAEIEQKEGVTGAVVDRIVLPVAARDGIAIDMEVEYEGGAVPLRVSIGG